MLKVDGIDVAYNGLQALYSVSMEVKEGEFLALVGSNGAGKSTLLNSVAGILRPSAGAIYLDGQRIDGLPPHRIVEMGISLIPEGKWMFPQMNVLENLLMGAYPSKARAKMNEMLEEVFQYFPRLKERQKQQAQTLSGGELQMLVIGRALMARPRLLILDEPSLGLAPRLVLEIFQILRCLHAESGITVILAEQNVYRALQMAGRGLVLENGRVVMDGPASSILEDESIVHKYLGM